MKRLSVVGGDRSGTLGLVRASMAVIFLLGLACACVAGTVWTSAPPESCPFQQSESILGVSFTGVHKNYATADTWYLTWAADDKMYSPFADGTVGSMTSICWREDAKPGYASVVGSDPMNLTVSPVGLLSVSAFPYGGRYPCGSLVYNGVWYYGTYCVMNENGSNLSDLTINGVRINWGVLGPFMGFEVCTNLANAGSSSAWTPSPHTGSSPLFPEPILKGKALKIGAPHFVDFGKNMQYSPDGKAYLVAHGARDDDPLPRIANLSWITSDQIYLLRVTPTPQNINDPSKYEFFGGYDDMGDPVWTSDFSAVQPLVDWNNNCGCVTMTYDAPLGKYLMCITDGWPTSQTMDTYILESYKITGPWKLATYMAKFGEQGYFVNFPSKFIGADGRSVWLCYSANFAGGSPDPVGSGYGMVLQQVQLLAPTAQAPDMDVTGRGRIIPLGAAPVALNGTDFGSWSIGAVVDHTFSVANTGSALLNLTGSPRVSISGPNASDFSVATDPAASVAVGGASRFVVRFAPSGLGLRTATISIASNDDDKSPYEVAVQGTGLTPVPEIDVSGNGISIANGDTTPRASDGTDFGAVDANGGTATFTYTLSNVGYAGMSLSGSPLVAVTGANAADFTVTAQPDPSIPARGATTFVVRFKPSAVGMRTATLSIVSDDSRKSPFEFGIRGLGVVAVPLIVVTGNGTVIPDGDRSPNLPDGTDFGVIGSSGGTIDRTFNIGNVGYAGLNLTGSPKVSISGDNASDFSVTAQPSSQIGIGGGASFTVRFNPTALGLRTAIVSIASDDASRNPYDFAIRGAKLPTDSLALWLKGDAGVTKDGTGFVSAWTDQAAPAGSLKVVQSNPAYQPSFSSGLSNGLPGVTFAGNTYDLATSATLLGGTTPFTVFSVFRITSLPGTNYQYVWWDGVDLPWLGYGVYVSAAGRLRTSWGGSTSVLTLTNSAALNTWYRTCSRYASGLHDAWLNGTFIGYNTPTQSSLSSGFAVGNCAVSSAYQALCGDVGEILVYGKKLTDAELQSVDAYLAGRWQPILPVSKDRIADLASLGDGALVSITSPKVVTAASGTFADGSCYIEELDRSCGIRVTGATLDMSENVTVTGMISTDATGERSLNITSVDGRSPGTDIGALGMANKAVTPKGLLVTVWGKVTERSTSYFALDDGSGSPIRVQTSGLSTPLTAIPDVSQFVAVTGPVGLMAPGTPVVRVRAAADIRAY